MEDELDEPGAVAEVDEDQAAVVAAAVHPAGDPRLGVDPVGEHLAAPGVAVARSPAAAGSSLMRRRRLRRRSSCSAIVEASAALDRPLLAALHVAQLRAAVLLEDQRRCSAPIRSACFIWPLMRARRDRARRESPARRSSSDERERPLRVRPSATRRTTSRRGLARPSVLAQREQDPLDPGRPADRRRRRPAELLDQPVVAAAAADLRLGAEPRRSRTRRPCACSSRGREPASGRARRRPRPRRAARAPRRSARRRRPRGGRASSARSAITARVPSSSESKARSGLIVDPLADVRRRARPRGRAGRRSAPRGRRARASSEPRLPRRSSTPGTPSSRSRSASSTISSASASGESVPIASAPIWWNWRKRPACGRSWRKKGPAYQSFTGCGSLCMPCST